MKKQDAVYILFILIILGCSQNTEAVSKLEQDISYKADELYKLMNNFIVEGNYLHFFWYNWYYGNESESWNILSHDCERNTCKLLVYIESPQQEISSYIDCYLKYNGTEWKVFTEVLTLSEGQVNAGYCELVNITGVE